MISSVISVGGAPVQKFWSVSPHSRCTEWDRAEPDPGGHIHMNRFSFDPAQGRTLPGVWAGSRAGGAARGMMGAALPPPSHAQAPALGTTADFAVLGGSTVTNTG